ncbi:hypothetical protein BDV30DRAFT_228159 [Aspergillus minisclerotigenes]|uniref:Myb-like domain-containing protein n=1 Tax=Aspergillus minisclerotigenes TaxID=656917 RepID=A0A5N6IZJ0_9EURO|nr:hypothetical protein BDV30DRAFT_228159 [Aspergillus minisclerotigenes]
MPVLIVDGERYRVPFMPFFRGYSTNNERWLTYNAKNRGKFTPEAPGSPKWSAQDDMTLQDLRNCNIPWKYISAAMNNKPIEDLKERWLNLRDGITQEIVAKPRETNQMHFVCELPGKAGRSVSFSDPLATNDNADDYLIASRPSKVKHVLYTDENFDLEDVLLLHTIAAKWERGKWLAVSTQFNDRTGRSITPDEAKSMIDPEEVWDCDCHWGT